MMYTCFGPFSRVITSLDRVDIVFTAKDGVDKISTDVALRITVVGKERINGVFHC